MSRHKAMLTHERRWFEQAQWDRVLNGTSTPKENLEIILADIDKAIVQN
jgi:hypothetical protein